jgi:3-methyladenine DNA glycosylase AlkC
MQSPLWIRRELSEYMAKMLVNHAQDTSMRLTASRDMKKKKEKQLT